MYFFFIKELGLSKSLFIEITSDKFSDKLIINSGCFNPQSITSMYKQGQQSHSYEYN